MRSEKLWLIMLGLMILIAGCASNIKEKPLETAKVTRGNILAQLPVTGVVIPRNRLEIKPPVAGRIEEVLVAEGQKVAKGQVLAWMSSSERAALLDAARAKGAEELKYWQDVYRSAPIVAPLNGFVIKRQMEPGQFFNTSDSVLVMADRLIVQAQVDETDIGRVSLRQKAIIKLDAYPEKAIDGKVEQIAYESETINNVTVYKVNVLSQRIPSFFRAGMSATVNFLMGERNGVLVLPLTAIKRRNSQTFAFIRKDDKIKAAPVQTGLENSEQIELLSGLAEGDEIIIPTQKIAKQALGTGPHIPFNILGGRRR